MSTDLKQFNKIKKNKKRTENITEYEERLIKVSRVSKVTKGGKKISFRAIAVIGNKNGKVGIGVAKADDVIDAFKKAKTDARKNLIKIELTKSLTISHDVIGHFGACKVIMRPSIEGSGVIAGGAVRTVLEVAGIKNIIAKQLGSNNLLNNARASIIALNTLTNKSQIIKNRDLNFN
jgi:small subunit ribosomal protein S5